MYQPFRFSDTALRYGHVPETKVEPKRQGKVPSHEDHHRYEALQQRMKLETERKRVEDEQTARDNEEQRRQAAIDAKRHLEEFNSWLTRCVDTMRLNAEYVHRCLRDMRDIGAQVKHEEEERKKMDQWFTSEIARLATLASESPQPSVRAMAINEIGRSKEDFSRQLVLLNGRIAGLEDQTMKKTAFIEERRGEIYKDYDMTQTGCRNFARQYENFGGQFVNIPTPRELLM